MNSLKNVTRLTNFVAAALLVAAAWMFVGPWSPRAAAQSPPVPDPPASQAELPAPSSKPVEPGYLGIVGDDHQEGGAGVRVLETESGGPADHGGLKADDLITGINGKPVHGQEEMRTILELLPSGSRASFEVERDGKKQTVSVMLGTRPPKDKRRFSKFGEVSDEEQPPGSTPPAGAAARAANGGGPRPVETPPAGIGEAPRAEPARRPLLGVRTQPVGDTARQRLALPPGIGAIVVARTAGSPAEKAGIPIGAAITAVNGAAVGSPDELVRLVAQAGAGHEIEVSYVADGQPRTVKVRLAGAVAGPENGGDTLPAPPREPFPSALPALPDDNARIEALERRVQELENRVRELEQAQKKPR